MNDSLAYAHDTAASRLGGALALIGGLGYVGLLIVHGDLPDETAAVALAHIAGRGEWRLLKLGLVAALLCWVGALTALERSLGAGVGGLLARWSVGVAAVGASIVAVEYAIIGHALKDVAVAWQAAPTAERAGHVAAAEIMLAISGGLFHSFVAWMLGLPIMLAGAAVALSRRWPRWLGWPAVGTGSGALVAGLTRFLGVEWVPYPLLYGAFVIPSALWLAVVGVFLWREGRAPRSEGEPRRPLQGAP
jgi:hypothetical protein